MACAAVAPSYECSLTKKRRMHSDAEQVVDRLSQLADFARLLLEEAKAMKLKLAQAIRTLYDHPVLLDDCRRLMAMIDEFAVRQRGLASRIDERLDLVIYFLEDMKKDDMVKMPLVSMMEDFIETTDRFDRCVQEFKSLQSQIEPRDSVGNTGIMKCGGMLVGVAAVLGVVFAFYRPVGWVAVPIGVAGFVSLGGCLYFKKGGFVEEPCSTIHGAMVLDPEIRKEVKGMLEEIDTIVRHLKGGNIETITNRLKNMQKEFQEINYEFRSILECREWAAPNDFQQAALIGSRV